MKYLIGDIVQIRPDLELYRDYGAFSTTREMFDYVGQTQTITGIGENGYRLSNTINTPWWTDQMLQPVAIQAVPEKRADFKVDDLVTIPDDIHERMRKYYGPGSFHAGEYIGKTFAITEITEEGNCLFDYADSNCVFEWHPLWLDLAVTPKGYVLLKEGSYRPFEIPRRNKSPRKICAPDDKLKAYQRKQLPKLEQLFFQKEKASKVTNIVHGFVPDRNCVTAAEQHIGYDLTIMMDIVAFFDSVTKEHTKYEDTSLYTVEGYCGQGFPTSPMLANIGVISIVQSINDYLQLRFPNNYVFTVYADDIQISINSDNQHADANEVIEVVTAAFEFFNFEIHPHKTRIRYAKHGYRRILGINVGNDHIRATRKTIRKLRAAKHQSNGPSAGGLTTWSRCLRPRKLRQS